jgi:hypothetical protein
MGCGTWSRSPLGIDKQSAPTGKVQSAGECVAVEDFDPTPPNRSRWLTARSSGERESDEPSHLVGHISG